LTLIIRLGNWKHGAEARIGASKTTSEPMATKTAQQAFSLPDAYFVEHLTVVIEKPPRKHDKKLGKLKPWIRRLKNRTDCMRNNKTTTKLVVLKPTKIKIEELLCR
jgi:hypothetical protein